MKYIKLIWDFYGPNAEKTAEHHEKHLKEYIASEKLNIPNTGFETISEMQSIAYMVVTQDQMKPIRDTLKPHRGVYVEL